MAAELSNENVSKIFTGETQGEAEQTPTEPLATPKASGNFVVDDIIVACMCLKFLSYVTIDAHHSPTDSLSSPWHKNCPCVELRRVITGKDGQSQRSVTFRQEGELFP